MTIDQPRSLEDFRSVVSRWQVVTCIVPALLFAIVFDRFVLPGHLILIGFSTLLTMIYLLIFRKGLRVWAVFIIIASSFLINVALSFVLPAETGSVPVIAFVPVVLIEFSIVYLLINAALKSSLSKV